MLINLTEEEISLLLTALEYHGIEWLKYNQVYNKLKSTSNNKYAAGELLFKESGSSAESTKYYNSIPIEQRVFMTDGRETADGYGQVIGFDDGKLVHTTGPGNFQFGGTVRHATEDEIKKFINAITITDYIRYR